MGCIFLKAVIAVDGDGNSIPEVINGLRNIINNPESKYYESMYYNKPSDVVAADKNEELLDFVNITGDGKGGINIHTHYTPPKNKLEYLLKPNPKYIK